MITTRSTQMMAFTDRWKVWASTSLLPATNNTA